MGNLTTKELVVAMRSNLFTVADIQDEWLDWTDAEVGKIVIGGVPEILTITDEYHDGETATTKHFWTNNRNIVAVTELMDNAIDDPTEVLPSDYVFYPEEGLIKLKTDADLGTQGYFTKGSRTIKISYTYGITPVDKLVVELATLIVLKLALLSKGVGSVTREMIGDYSVGYDKDSTINKRIEEIKEIIGEEGQIYVI